MKIMYRVKSNIAIRLLDVDHSVFAKLVWFFQIPKSWISKPAVPFVSKGSYFKGDGGAKIDNKEHQHAQYELPK